jgi:hypothetical protein
MIARSAPLLAVALACLAAPAPAQDELGPPPPLPELVTDDLPPDEEEDVRFGPSPLPEPTADGGWDGEWQGEWAEDGTYRGTWNGTYSDPGPTASRVIYPGVAANTGYGAAERTAWLNQCRTVYYPNSAATGAVVNAQTDVCESYLQQYERSYAMGAQGVAPAAGGFPVAPGAYAPGGYGYPNAPVMWVRVPIIRQPVEAGD